MFSRLSVKLNKQRAFRLDSLVEIIIDSYKPKSKIIFVEEVADFRKFASDKDQPNHEGIPGNVLITLNSIREQKQFWIRRVLGDDGFIKTEFHAKHLSTTKDWGELVPFLRYIPTSPMWIAPQMALKAASDKAGQQAAGSEDEEEDADVQKQNNDSKILAKYRKAIIDQGFNYFRDEDKLWWIRFFENQEEILRHHLEPETWRFEWMWPARCTVPFVAAEEIPLAVPDHLLQKVTGKQTTMYSGRRKATS